MGLKDEKIKVKRQFAADFETVAAYYKLHEFGEYEEAKEKARRDLDDAVICYTSIAKLLRGD